MNTTFSQTVFPVWFRAYLLVPLLATVYFAVPVWWVFSPSQLGSLPYVIVGGDDWGGGNIFAFTKIMLWGALVLGCLANNRAVRKLPHAPSAATIWTLLIRHTFHLTAVLILCIGYTILAFFGEPHWETVSDVWQLALFFFAGVAVVLVTVAVTRTLSLATATTASVLVAGVWGLIPVGMG